MLCNVRLGCLVGLSVDLETECAVDMRLLGWVRGLERWDDMDSEEGNGYFHSLVDYVLD